MSFFVKHPPEGDEHYRLPPRSPLWDPYTRGIEPEYGRTEQDLEACKSSWDETGNALYALEAFRVATSAGLYPPLWVINLLAERFSRAILSDQSLDRAFGFSGKGRGRGRWIDPVTEDRLRARDRALCLMIFKLEGAGLSRPAACKALASRLARLRDGERLGAGPEYSTPPMTLSYKAIGNAVAAAEGMLAAEKAATAEASSRWTDAEKRALLSLFYPSELPAKIVRELGL